MLRRNRNDKVDEAFYSDRPDLEPPENEHPTVTKAAQLPILNAMYPRASCWETCGVCETEFVMAAYRPEPCPHCGFAVLPCNMCDPDVVNCDECPYSNYSGVRMGPDLRSEDELYDDDDDYYDDYNRKPYRRMR